MELINIKLNTLSPISVIGMTCFGSIYEYDAIYKWFENNDTDPLTNRLEICRHLKILMRLSKRNKKSLFHVLKVWTNFK